MQLNSSDMIKGLIMGIAAVLVFMFFSFATGCTTITLDPNSHIHQQGDHYHDLLQYEPMSAPNDFPDKRIFKNGIEYSQVMVEIDASCAVRDPAWEEKVSFNEALGEVRL